MRKHVLEYDDVMNKHRERIYKMRKEILTASDAEIKNKIKELLNDEELKQYKEKEEKIGEEIRKIEKFVILNTIDMFWMAHLDTMDHLRESVGLRAYGHRDPLVEYKNEGHRLFKKLLEDTDFAIGETLLKAEFKKRPAASEPQAIEGKPKKKVGRNEPCPCGKINPETGKPFKYKKCCGK
jgi:preprotein translocase subunit SecA